MDIRIIGIDCATVANRVGISIAQWDGEKTTIVDLFLGDPSKALASIVTGSLLKELEHPRILFALDAPLGWPVAFKEGLHNHIAGARFGDGKRAVDSYFRRRTDDYVHNKLKKRPLEVTANLIARTAYHTLEFLEALGPSSLLWSADAVPPTPRSVIEVYPAATLISHGGDIEGYKKNREKRAILSDLIADSISGVGGFRTQMIDSDHLLDAAACTLAAHDFLKGEALAPSADDLDYAKREGWIWFKQPAGPSGK